MKKFFLSLRLWLLALLDPEPIHERCPVCATELAGNDFLHQRCPACEWGQPEQGPSECAREVIARARHIPPCELPDFTERDASRFLAEQYGVGPDGRRDIRDWMFHWGQGENVTLYLRGKPNLRKSLRAFLTRAMPAAAQYIIVTDDCVLVNDFSAFCELDEDTILNTPIDLDSYTFWNAVLSPTAIRRPNRLEL